MKIFKKNLKKKMLATLIPALLTSTLLAACGGPSFSDKAQTLFDTMEKDASVAKLKTDLAGYSTAPMEIISNKQEISQQSTDLINAFNKYYGTDLTYTQVGGSTDYGQYLTSKLINGVGDILLISAGSRAGFQSINTNLVDTPASKMLNNDDTATGEYVIGDKHFMPQTIESYGVIYNKAAFTKAKVVVYEGKSFEDATTKPTDLVKPGAAVAPVEPAQPQKQASETNKAKEAEPKAPATAEQQVAKVTYADEQQPASVYNGTISKDGTLYVFTSDLTVEGYKAIVSQVEAAQLKPFYTTSKAPSGNIWPLTNHLLGAAVAATTDVTQDNIDIKQPEKILTDDAINSVKQALEIYGQDKEYNQNTNTVDTAMQQVALGTEYAMSQNGTWATPQIIQANPTADVGFLPLPVFGKTDQKAKFVTTVSQRWAMTTLGNDEAKSKTAKLFLQFLYQTKSGVEYAINDMQLRSPYKHLDGINYASNNDKLLASANNYTPKDYVASVDNYFVGGFNNQDKVLVKAVNDGFADANLKATLIAEWKKLETAPSNQK